MKTVTRVGYVYATQVVTILFSNVKKSLGSFIQMLL